MDQAQSLKNLVRERNRDRKKSQGDSYSCEIIAVTSGKGGVGKTQISLNLALALSKRARVLLLDADMGTANVDVLLGIDPRKNLSHVLNQGEKIRDILVPITPNLKLLPGSSGLTLRAPTHFGWAPVIEEADQLSADFDYIIIDTAAGISETIISILCESDRVILVCTSEPTAIVDAYALSKTLLQRNPNRKIELIANSVQNEEEAREIHTKLQGAFRHFLNKDISYLSHILYDNHIIQSIHQQKPIYLSSPDLPVSKLFSELATKLAHGPDWRGGKGLSQVFRILKG